jgi:hypothetical protein
MRSVLRLHLVSIAALLALSPLAIAQTTPQSQIPLDDSATPAQVRTLLQSSNPREQAWGGWLAARKDPSEMVPTLLKVVVQQLSTTGMDTDAAMDTPLDALIQFKARLSPELLLEIGRKRSAAALTLLAMLGSDADPVLLKVVKEGPGQWQSGPWLAAANLLTRHRTPGFAALLLSRLSTTGILIVGSATASAGLGIGEAGSRDGPAYFGSNGLPPWPTYEWEPNVSELFAGPMAVNARRDVARAGSVPRGTGHSLPAPTTAGVLVYIGALAHLDPMPVHAVEYRYMPKGSTQDQIATDALRFEQGIRKDYATLVRMLISASVLTETEAAQLPDPQVNVVVRLE